MKKYFLFLLIGLILSVISAAPVFAQAKSCGDTDTNNWCGAAGGCADGSLCKNNWFSSGGTCTATDKCKNMDQSAGKYCGSDNQTPNSCGADGACATGFKCIDPYLSDPYCEESSSCSATTADSTTSATTCSTKSGCGYCADSQDFCTPEGALNAATCTKVDGQCGYTKPTTTTALLCGQTTTDSAQSCSCSGSNATGKVNVMGSTYCCGYIENGKCNQTATTTTKTESDSTTTGDTSQANDTTKIDPFAGPSSANFKALNPLEMFNSTAKDDLSSPGGIISRILLFSFPIAGLILFAMLVWAGFEIVLGSAGGKSIEAGRQRATAAIIGFGLLFVSYWLMQIVEVVFGVTIL